MWHGVTVVSSIDKSDTVSLSIRPLTKIHGLHKKDGMAYRLKLTVPAIPDF